MGDYKISIARKYSDPNVIADVLADTILKEGRISKDKFVFASSRLPPGVNAGDVLADARNKAANTLRLFRSTYGKFKMNDHRLDVHRAYIRSRLPVHRVPRTPIVVRVVRSIRQFFHDLERTTRPQ